MKTKTFLMIAAFAIFSFASCTKESTIDQASLDVVDDDAVTDAVFEDVFNTVDNADIILDDYQKGGDAKSFVLSDSCPTITIDHPSDAVWPKTITIDFGNGCTGLYNNTRSGKIIIAVTGPRLATSSKKTVTLDNYYINGIKVEGTKVHENMGTNNDGHMVFKVTLTDGKLTLPDGDIIERSFEQEREWTAGLNTRNIWDDECLVTGTGEGLTINDVAYSTTITTELHWKRVCMFIVSGVVNIEREGLNPVVVDFGTGECDALATVTSGGYSKEVTLRFRHRSMGK